MTTKEEALKEIAEAKARIEAAEAILNEEKTYGRERVEEGKDYWYESHLGCIGVYKEAFDGMDNLLFNMGNYYHTKEEVEKARDRQLAYVRITDAIREQNKGWVPDWNSDKQIKCHVGVRHDHGFLIESWREYQLLPNELYGTQEAIEYVIKHHADDIKLYLGVES